MLKNQIPPNWRIRSFAKSMRGKKATPQEIIVFDRKDELGDLITYYLEHDEERKAIAQAGYERTMRDHLWKHRLKNIFQEIEGG